MVSVTNRQFNLQFKEDSDDEFLERGNQENEANSLKLSKFVEEDFYTAHTLGFKNDEELKYRVAGSKKKKDKRRKKRTEDTKRISNRKIVNLPASQPYTRFVDGEERLCFKYNTKISDAVLSSMPKTDLEDNEFCIRFDIENVDISKLNEKFKSDNCVYPRANLPFEMYVGNRWEYETECNRLAWAFVSLNPVLLYGKKGLIQRAVDSYRNINKQSRTKKIFKDDKFTSDVDKRRHLSLAPSSVTINWISRGIKKKCKIQVNIESIDINKIDEDFKNKFSVFMDDFDANSFGLAKYESKNKNNELAVKIAFLNIENMSFWNAIKALDKTTVLKRAIEAYNEKKEELISSEDDTDVSTLVARTIEDQNDEDLEKFLLG